MMNIAEIRHNELILGSEIWEDDVIVDFVERQAITPCIQFWHIEFPIG
jgi:hypothetical protein